MVTGDARVNLRRQPDDSRDVVIGDAFGHLVVPWHLATRELVQDVRRVLRPDGVYALNLIDGPRLRFARAETGSNFVVFASDAPLLDVHRADVQAVSGDRLGEFVGAAPVLTDDHAPVDQLLLLR